MYQLTVNNTRHGVYLDAAAVLKAGSVLWAAYRNSIPNCIHSRACWEAPHRKPCYFCASYDQVCEEWQEWEKGRIEIGVGFTITVARLSLAVMPL